MSAGEYSLAEVLLEVRGQAADHLYREGSAKASFWETLFGSSLRAKKRVHISAQADGTRVFDVPLLGLETQLLEDARAWFASAFRDAPPAAAASALKDVAVKLIGLQPQGQSVASFSLRFDLLAGPASPEIREAFGRWFDEERARLSQDLLVPFGFTPQAS